MLLEKVLSLRFYRNWELIFFDADIASRQAVARGSQGLQQVIDVFGRDYLTIDGELDRQKIAQLVFENKAALGQLESIVHTYVRSEAKKIF